MKEGSDGMKIATNQDRLCELFDIDPRTDSAIADALNVSKQTISAWRAGIRSPKKPMLLKLCRMYNVTLDWLMGYDEDNIEPAEFLKNEQENYRPLTNEAKIISRGIDGLDDDQRKKALDMLRLMFDKDGEIFTDYVKEYYDTKDGPKDD